MGKRDGRRGPWPNRSGPGSLFLLQSLPHSAAVVRLLHQLHTVCPANHPPCSASARASATLQFWNSRHCSILLLSSHFASVWEFCNDRLNVHNTMLTMFLGANRCVSTCACSCWWWVFDSSTSTYLCKAIGSPAIERPPLPPKKLLLIFFLNPDLPSSEFLNISPFLGGSKIIQATPLPSDFPNIPK